MTSVIRPRVAARRFPLPRWGRGQGEGVRCHPVAGCGLLSPRVDVAGGCRHRDHSTCDRRSVEHRAIPTKSVLTYADYAALPDDGRRYELHQGELSDIVYVANDRLSIVSERAIEGAPTLAVEVLSPSSSRVDRQRKLALYAQHGVPY